ncbi:hypothetical protein KIW84_077130 [Lathyrus oleraceus]|uniref:Uncharacterized protein n=1 Tax=Pisum sativum TaxID=3888 RepID=A0A9D4W016_PEA|nr:hypothetical protein KIW84_077130 [Pisum sativum]
MKSSKQDTVADSTTEAEYIAASNAEKGVVWIKKFISELGIVPSIVDPIGIYYDNNGAITQAKEPRSHRRSKHILRCYHLIREIIDRGDVKICKVPTLDNSADPLTKPLAQQKHDGHTRSMGIRGYANIFLVSILSAASKFYHSTSKSCYQVASKLHSLNQTHTPGVPKQQITSLIQIMFIVMDTSNLAALDNGRVLPNFIGKKVRIGVQVNQPDGAVITRTPFDDS